MEEGWSEAVERYQASDGKGIKVQTRLMMVLTMTNIQTMKIWIMIVSPESFGV